ncbi:MAG TPA: efflux RND transporter permease subunit [Candidatus Acidoferrales bacterium]|nr:efflux RND transporter permease subunit [Candidatus Acidoferrales bacterium]
MNVVRFCRDNRYAVYLLTAFLVVAGVYSALVLPSNIYPELNFPRVMILAHAGDLAPDIMLLTVTRPLEESASTAQGVRRVRSKTIRGASEISVQFRPDMDMQYALQLLQARVSEARSSLPPDTELAVERITPAVFPVLSLILNGHVPAKDLRDYAFYVLRPLFSRVPGVGRVEVQASDTREIDVIVDPQRMLAHRLSLVDVADRLRATNLVTSVGRLQKDYLQYLVLSSSQFTSLEEIRNTVVTVEGQTPVHLREIAEVRDAVEDRRTLITGNGQTAALINISRQIGGDILRIANAIKGQAAHLGSAIPATLKLSVVYDLAEFVHEAIANVRDAILIGGVLAVLILFVFLREGRTTLVAATTLPLSVISTFFFIKLFGGTLNLMSLGGLAIAIGLIIDDAVVVIENIYRHLGLGESPKLAAENGTRELLGAVVGSTATTLVVFLPLGLLTGVVGEFFVALCLTLGVSVLLSLVFALAVIPLFSQRLLTIEAHRPSSERFIEPVNRVYEKAVRWALENRKIVAGATLASVLIGVFLYTRLETGFLPEMDEGGYVLDYWTPPGTSLAETDRILHGIEDRVARMPETGSFSRRTGAELGLFATEQNRGDILVKLKPRSERKRHIDEVINDLRAQILENVPGVRVEFVQILQDMIGDMEGNPEPVEIKLFGDNMERLSRTADEIGEKVQKIPGIVDFQGLKKGNPEIVFHVDPAQAGRVGLTVDQVSQQVGAGLLGLTETSLREADRTVGIRVRFPDEFRGQYANIRQFPVVTPSKQIVPLNSVAQVEEAFGSSQLSRENQRLMVSLTARLENRDLGSAIRDVQRVMSETRLPVGFTYEIGGQYESQRSSFNDLLRVSGLALAAVFTVLVVQFRAFRPALIILSAAPLSLLGVFAMLKVTGTPLNVSSFMGIILMVGLVVKNGIILFEYVHKLWEEQKLPLDEALVASGRIRVRPILMTTLATLFGLLPLALGLGSGAELQKPLALAVIGGLLLSTFITLLVMPVLYSLLEGRHITGE